MTIAAGCAGLLLLTACGGSPPRTHRRPAPAPAPARTVTPARGPRGPLGHPLLPVPRGKGSTTPDDFNGDGHRDLVIDDLVKAPTTATATTRA
ncbi:hypothetical protein NKH18_24555 [Streptomyces sp. M10(2022)]